MIVRLYIKFSLHETEIHLDSDDTHYIRTVLRKEVGDSLLVFNEQVGEAEAKIVSQDKKSCLLHVEQIKRQPKREAITRLVFAPLKHDAMAFLFEKGAELGVTHFQPILTDHAQNYKFHYDKVSRQLRQAAQQCNRLSVPEIEPLVRFHDAIERLESLDALNYIGVERLCEESLLEHIVKEEDKTRAVNFIVGPEGGFSPRELAYLSLKESITQVSLGENVLRAETAALSGLSLFSAWRLRAVS